MLQFIHRDFFSVAYSIWVRRVASAYLLSEPTIFLGKCLYQVRNVLFFSCSVDWKLRWLSFLSVLSVFVDFPFWMRLGVRYHCYYLYSVVCQQIWRNVLPLFFPRYTGVKKTQHYKLFISNPIVLFWRTKKKNNSNITGRTVSALLTEELLEKIMLAKTKHKKLWRFYWNPFCCLGRVMDNATVSSLYCIALYDNYIALNDKIQKWRNFSKNC